MNEPLLLIFYFFGSTFAGPDITVTTLGLPSTFESQTTSSPYTPPSRRVSTPYPCLYGICNGTCCESTLVETFFDCANGQKINRSLICNRINDCEDGSDESRCDPWPPKITVLPKFVVQVYCGDQDEEKSGTLTLECQSVGNPMPVIRWKKYDGHVPSKCTQFSQRGHGILTCPNFRQSDQGAYSCVAENSVKSAESQPKSIAKCNNTINCKGFRVVNEEQIEHCLECYCSGRTTQCQSIKSNAAAIRIPFPESQTEIFVKENGEILFVPTKTKSSPEAKIRDAGQAITYCSLSENDFPEKSFVKSFGRNFIFPRHTGKINFLEKAPDLIIRGNGLSLMYSASLLSLRNGSIVNVAARFWPGNWHHLNKQYANRRDIMKVLSNLDTIFIRCEYEQGETLRLNETVVVESSTITDSVKSVSYVEKCNCPSGYDGLSCETCAAGYKLKPQAGGFVCEKIYVPPPCKEGYVGTNCSSCDTTKGYYKSDDVCLKAVCHPEGALTVFPNALKKCSCRERVTGELCDRCENDSFYLHKERGCLKCWCSGISNKCNSSKLYRTVISNTPRGGYNSSDGRNFWLLPLDFSGNRLTSYGGYLNYTMKYKPFIPKQSTYLTVELLSMDDVTLVYTHSTLDTSTTTNEKSWFVPLIEIHWRKSDKTAVTRAEFLTVLSKVKAIYVESPYHLSSGQANLTSARMSSATSSDDDAIGLALEVEQCRCPEGYTGLSCERCSEGHYKKRNGTVTQCIKCNCTNCDPDFGCPDCPPLTYRDNPEEEKMPLCKACPCNGNALSCVKDDLNQIFCRCKPGFVGMHCENKPPSQRSDLTISLTPRRIKGKKIDTHVFLNCSVISNEEMTLSFRKTYLDGTRNKSFVFLHRGSQISEIVDVVLEAGLQTIEYYVHDADGLVAGHVFTVVEDLITDSKPVKITNCYSDRIEVKESEIKDLICKATGSPSPMINWYKTTIGSTAKKVDTLEGVHTIEPASLKDNGTVYTCVAENSEGDKATCTSFLVVRKKCEVINVIPKSVRTVEGKNVTIQCKTSAKSPVAWFTLDTLLGERRITSPRIKVQNGELRIINASVSDSGTYVCTAEGENGKLNQTVAVVVEEKRVPPSVLIQEYDKILKVGESFEVHCTVTGKPTPGVTWTKLNDSLGVNVYTSGKNLKIEKATVGNSGIYICEARSVSGNASSYISITVEKTVIPPTVNMSPDSVVAQVGEEVLLSCLAFGYPRPRLTWYGINGTTISRQNDSAILIEPLESIKEEVKFIVTKEMNTADIICFADNKAGSAQKTSRIKVLQSKGLINETVEFVPIGSYFELQCEFTGELKWEKRDGSLVGDECRIPYALSIQSVQIQHNGTYICKDDSNSEKIINLMVIGFVPKFSRASKSYLVLPVQLNSFNEIRIELSFNPTHESGVLLQEENSKLDIYLKDKNVHLSISNDKRDSLDITMNKPITLGKWYSLIVSINRNYVDVTIYDEKTSIYDRKTEKGFEAHTGIGSESFFVGGSIPRGRHVRNIFFRRHPHFDGCISRLSINRREFDILKNASHSHNVALCKKCSEELNTCGESGKCLDAPTQRGFICVCPREPRNKSETCPASCNGKGCETQLDLCRLLNPCNNFIHKCIHNMNSLQCTCAYGYSGTTCEKVQQYSFCAKGNGYVKLPSKLLERYLGTAEVIRMSFTLHNQSGQLLWQGSEANHLSVSVHDRQLRYVYLNQHSKLQIYAGRELSLNKQYSIMIRRLNGTAVLNLNFEGQPYHSYQNSTYPYHTNRVVGDIFLGNVPNNTYHAGHHVGLNGCIHYVSFGEKAKVNLPENEIEKFNVFVPQKLNQIDYTSDESDYNDGDSDSNEV